MPPYIKISAYHHYVNKDGIAQPGCLPYDTDLYTELYRIRDGYYQSIIDTLRGMEDKEERGRFKARQLPSMTISAVTHTWRKYENLVNHTGLLNIDIDKDHNPHVTDWAEMRDNLFKSNIVVAAWVSASGAGCSLVLKINPEQHLEVFESVRYDLKLVLDLNIDVVCKDVVRLRFVSYDPDCKIRDDFDSIPLSEPSVNYKLHKANQFKYTGNYTPTGKPDSLSNFKNAIASVESEGRQFVEGEKHWYLVAIAGYCNATGMNKEFCKRMVVKHFSDKTSIPLNRLLQPIENVYDTYKTQFGSVELQHGAEVSFKVLRWFLSKFHKDLLRPTFHLLGKKIISGRTSYHIKVDSPLLAYAMWLVAPDYTWTTLGDYDQYMPKEVCATVFPKGHKLISQDDKRIWIKDVC